MLYPEVAVEGNIYMEAELGVIVPKRPQVRWLKFAKCLICWQNKVIWGQFVQV